MNKIFWGFIFIFFSFYINIDAIHIDFLPDFIGYLFMLQGFSELVSYSDYFEKVRPITITAIIIGLFVFLLGLGGFPTTPIITIPFSLIVVLLNLILMYHLTKGLFDVEKQLGTDLNVSQLESTFKVIVVLSVIISLLNLVAYLIYAITYLSLFIGLILFVMYIVYVVSFYKSKKLYEQSTHRSYN